MTMREEAARNAFKSGFNCSQSIMAAFADLLPIPRETALLVASGFGGGMGRLREVCGAVTGIFMVAGMLYGYNDANDYEGKKQLYGTIQELAGEFKADSGSIICRDLLGQTGKDNSAVPSKRTEEYYKVRPCEEKIALAVRILEKHIAAVEAAEHNGPCED